MMFKLKIIVLSFFCFITSTYLSQNEKNTDSIAKKILLNVSPNLIKHPIFSRSHCESIDSIGELYILKHYHGYDYYVSYTCYTIINKSQISDLICVERDSLDRSFSCSHSFYSPTDSTINIYKYPSFNVSSLKEKFGLHLVDWNNVYLEKYKISDTGKIELILSRKAKWTDYFN